MIRRALPCDTEALVALGESTGIFGPGEADALLRGTLDALHAGKLDIAHEVRVWTHPADGALEGWVYFGPKDSADQSWELYWIGVAPSRHGQGIGDALLRFVEGHVAAAGGTALYIETSSLPTLERARRFYARRGYAVHAVAPDHYGKGDDKLTFVKTSKTADDAAVCIAFLRADARHLAELIRLVEAYYAFDGISFDGESVRRGLTTLLETPSFGGAWLIREASDTLGYFVLTYGFDLELGGRQATVTELYLRPESRGRGVGHETLRFVEAHLREAGIGAYELQVDHGNARARAFYAAAGFAAHSRIPLSKKVPLASHVTRNEVARSRSGAIEIRAANASDCASVVRLAINLGRQHEAYDATRFCLGAFGDTPEELRRTYESFFREEIGKREVALWVAETADFGVVGYAYGRLEDPSFVEVRDIAGWIHDLFVDERVRGQSVGRRLVEAVIEALRERGAPQILLSVSPKNAPGQALFDRLGFATILQERRLLSFDPAPASSKVDQQVSAKAPR